MLSLLLSCALAALPQDPPAAFSVPLAFERHAVPGGDCFVARVAGHSVTIDAHGAKVRAAAPGSAERTELGIAFVGGEAKTVTGEAETPCKVDCFLGNDPAAWRTGIPTFARARVAAVWPGVDVVWHGRTGSLEYDFVVAAGADPAAIRLRFSGASLRLDSNGDLVQAAAGGEVRHQAPVAWQRRGSTHEPVAVRYELAADGTASFVLGERDPACELVIDPIVLYTARLDGLANSAASDQQPRLAVDALGHAIVAFQTSTPDLPTANPILATPGSLTDVFVAKFNPAGTGLVFATYLGGSAADAPGGVAVLPNGNIVVACNTGSPNYPLLGAAFPGPLVAFSGVAGVTVFTPAGALVWSTYYTLPTATSTPATDVAIDIAGNVVICGRTTTANLPVHAGAFQGNLQGTVAAYVARFTSGGAFLGATYFGTAGTNEAFDLAVRPNGDICVGGRAGTITTTIPVVGGFQGAHGGGTRDAWIAVFDQTLSVLNYSTYVGGNDFEALVNGEPLGIATDAAGRVVLVTTTESNNLPTTPGCAQPAFGGGAEDGLVVMVDPSLSGASSLVLMTYVGGNGSDGLYEVAIDAFGNMHAGGYTASTNPPLVHPLMPDSAGTDGYVVVLNPAGSQLRFATPFADEATVTGLALAADGTMFVAGGAQANLIPVTPGAFAPGGNSTGAAIFVAHIDPHLAQAFNYGAGHPGTLGVPSFAASANPIVGTTVDLLIGSSSGLPSLALLVLGTIPVSVPTSLGGTLLVGNPIAPLLTVTMAPAGGLFPLAIPNHPSWLGVDLFAQTAQLDPGASALFAFSAGLALQLGI
ncbi:MAG: hypothetical protein WBO45_25395 [Planctomycetota bacterium]